ncbi:MAG: penicillin acylase family protein [Candidatus Cloacimonetes bacterium]|nr:penicillin acylase family protein [Candidatus Cloacimonadota bacterium]
MKYFYNRFTALLITFIFVFIDTSASSESITLLAPDGSTVTINRDYFGVPHINGETETGVFYGMGFAAAQDRLAQMEDFRLAAEGKLSEVYGDNYLDVDQDIRTWYYTEAERSQLFNDLPTELKTMIQSYSDGVNTYLDSMSLNPSKYKPLEFANYEMEPWTVNKSVAVIQYMIRQFGQFGGEELTRLSELQNNGQTWFDQNRPINDPAAPTTIPDGNSPTARQWKYSNISIREEIIQSINSDRKRIEAKAKKIGLPDKFGSFAVLISGEKSDSDNVMLLGCPQMGAPEENEPQISYELELNCPTLHIAGISFAGMPIVIMGHTEYLAWSFTSGYSDNCDVYIDSTQDNSFSKYYYNGEWRDFEIIVDTIHSSNGEEHLFTHYRTVHGPVFGDDLENHQVFSQKMTFWKKELDMMTFILGMTKAENVSEVETAASLNPMSFNLFYAGKDQIIKYWHTGFYQDRTDGVDPRLPHKGDGSEEWGGYIPFENLPVDENPEQGYFVNWNNKPVSWWNNGDNVRWIGPQHVTEIDNYVNPISSFTYDNLKDVPMQIDDHGTYQQAIEFTDSDIIDENINPPGQSGFIDLDGNGSMHFSDQWMLHEYWRFKDQLFNYQPGDDPYPRIIFDETRIYLGSILNTSSPVDTVFYVHNTGESPDSIFISINYGGADSNAISVTPNKFIVAAGDSTPVTYTIDPSLLGSGLYSTLLLLDAKLCPSNFHFQRRIVFRIEEPTGVENENIPESFSLEQNYPNPFNPSTTITYALPESGFVSLIVYSILGEEVATLVNESKMPGNYSVEFKADNLSSGVYFYRLKVNDYAASKKMQHVK